MGDVKSLGRGRPEAGQWAGPGDLARVCGGGLAPRRPAVAPEKKEGAGIRASVQAQI
ncbi:MAG: hypothetical protein LBR11_09000 [Deltaproteobacteria bacterium]|nr:hypothetical protein [Deltaproteobacteria bacterium]